MPLKWTHPFGFFYHSHSYS